MSIGFEEPIFLILMPLIAIAFFLLFKRTEKPNLLSITYIVLFLLALFSLTIFLASPYVESETKLPEKQKVIIFNDNSNSMSVFEGIKDFGGFEVVEIGKNETSNLYGSIIANLKENSTAILVTDGYETSGPKISDLMALATELGVDFYYLNQNATKREGAIAIYGPKKVFPDTEANFLVKINGVNVENALMVVRVDNEIVYNGEAKDFRFTRKFSSGQHVLEADLKFDDLFDINNKYYWVVDVIEKPKVLFVSSKKDPIELMINQLYQADYINSPAQLENLNLDKYHAIIFNDVSDVPKNLTNIATFITKGNGLVVIGGENSFTQKYKGDFEEILPVKITGLEEEKESARIVLVIDISASTGQPFKTESGTIIVDVEKALAISIMDSLDDKSAVGAIAFNTKAYKIADIQSLAKNRPELREKISALKHFGGTEIAKGIQGAKKMLEEKGGKGDIILISDGRSSIAGDREQATIFAKKLSESGMRLHTISVGEKSDEEFLKKLANLGNGFFFKPQEYQKLKIIFSQQKDLEDRGRFSLLALNNEHFITRGVEIDSSAGSYNDVKAKSLSSQLVVTSNNRPALTVWRYGLGRVAAITVFDGKSLGNILEKDSELIARTINWAIGDPNRNLDSYVEVSDARINEKVEVYVKSKNFEGENFSQIDENLFFTQFRPEKLGIGEILNKKYAVNYPREYENFGLNPKILELVELTNGKIINAEDLSKIRDLIRGREKIVKSRQYVKDIFLISAIVIFLAGVVARRALENANQ
jgi:Mg-chelatase subunit ChlD